MDVCSELEVCRAYLSWKLEEPLDQSPDLWLGPLHDAKVSIHLLSGLTWRLRNLGRYFRRLFSSGSTVMQILC
eukprot:25522-Pleurochrysis_carterae.AAC.1